MIFEIILSVLVILLFIYIHRLHKIVDILVDNMMDFKKKNEDDIVAQVAVNKKLYGFIKTEKGMRMKDKNEIHGQINQILRKLKISIRKESFNTNDIQKPNTTEPEL